MTRPVIHVLDDIHPSAMERLRAAADLQKTTPSGDWHSTAEAVIVRTTHITAGDIARAQRLKVIGKHGSGTDAIDIEAARARGIAVVNSPGGNAESVADHALALALCLLRNIVGHDAALKAGTPLVGQHRIGFELGELTAGIVGLGAVGRATGRRLTRGFGARVAGFDPGLAPDAWPAGVERHSELLDLCGASRILFLHLPLTRATRGIINRDALQAMPAGSYLVNCARGGIVDEEALANALLVGHLAGAASDVFATEPPSADHPLLACSRFIATPHIGASTNRGLERVGHSIADAVLAALGQP